MLLGPAAGLPAWGQENDKRPRIQLFPCPPVRWLLQEREIPCRCQREERCRNRIRMDGPHPEGGCWTCIHNNARRKQAPPLCARLLRGTGRWLPRLQIQEGNQTEEMKREPFLPAVCAIASTSYDRGNSLRRLDQSGSMFLMISNHRIGLNAGGFPRARRSCFRTIRLADGIRLMQAG